MPKVSAVGVVEGLLHRQRCRLRDDISMVSATACIASVHDTVVWDVSPSVR